MKNGETTILVKSITSGLATASFLAFLGKEITSFLIQGWACYLKVCGGDSH